MVVECCQRFTQADSVAFQIGKLCRQRGHGQGGHALDGSLAEVDARLLRTSLEQSQPGALAPPFGAGGAVDGMVEAF